MSIKRSYRFANSCLLGVTTVLLSGGGPMGGGHSLCANGTYPPSGGFLSPQLVDWWGLLRGLALAQDYATRVDSLGCPSI